jgi:hypothetical protein
MAEVRSCPLSNMLQCLNNLALPLNYTREGADHSQGRVCCARRHWTVGLRDGRAPTQGMAWRTARGGARGPFHAGRP